jgi:DNA-binding LacI/PurR family transcriptional regulator
MSVTPGLLGAEGAEMLLKRIESPEGPLRTATIRPRLITRASTSRAPG